MCEISIRSAVIVARKIKAALDAGETFSESIVTRSLPAGHYLKGPLHPTTVAKIAAPIVPYCRTIKYLTSILQMNVARQPTPIDISRLQKRIDKWLAAGERKHQRLRQSLIRRGPISEDQGTEK